MLITFTYQCCQCFFKNLKRINRKSNIFLFINGLFTLLARLGVTNLRVILFDTETTDIDIRLLAY